MTRDIKRGSVVQLELRSEGKIWGIVTGVSYGKKGAQVSMILEGGKSRTFHIPKRMLERVEVSQ